MACQRGFGLEERQLGRPGLRGRWGFSGGGGRQGAADHPHLMQPASRVNPYQGVRECLAGLWEVRLVRPAYMESCGRNQGQCEFLGLWCRHNAPAGLQERVADPVRLAAGEGEVGKLLYEPSFAAVMRRFPGLDGTHQVSLERKRWSGLDMLVCQCGAALDEGALALLHQLGEYELSVIGPVLGVWPAGTPIDQWPVSFGRGLADAARKKAPERWVWLDALVEHLDSGRRR